MNIRIVYGSVAILLVAMLPARLQASDDGDKSDGADKVIDFFLQAVEINTLPDASPMELYEAATLCVTLDGIYENLAHQEDRQDYGKAMAARMKKATEVLEADVFGPDYDPADMEATTNVMFPMMRRVLPVLSNDRLRQNPVSSWTDDQWQRANRPCETLATRLESLRKQQLSER